MDANGLRAAFTRFFADRGHTIVPSASLIPHDPSVLFTIAGMVPFKPYFLGEEPAPWARATSIQKCFRTPDIEIIGTDTYHCTFFEMLGNFSFGDYFKDEAIPLAWELLTEVFGFDGDRLWVTVHDSDDEAEELWIDGVGLRPERVQRMGDEDNFWAMGETGPCGPDSEIFVDLGESYGHDGGPKHGGDARFVEIWNLVFMQYNRDAAGTLTELPRKNIDTGAGLERILPVLQGHDSVFDTDLFLPLIDAAASILGTGYGKDPANDVALRVLADHGRAFSMLVADGVLPANEGRGYVLRRVVRRAVLAARRSGVDKPIGPALVQAATEVLGEAHPTLRAQHDLIVNVIAREEAGFDRTLKAGLSRLEEAFATGTKVLQGDVAFTLHDTHGFPVELTEELARDAGVEVDRSGFDAAMAAQRERARAAAKSTRAGDEAAYRALLEAEGATVFVGRGQENYEVPARVVAVLEPATEPAAGDKAGDGGGDGEPGERLVEIFLDRTPFYAESGGQVGDTGTIVTESGIADVQDTVLAVPGLFVHRARVSGEIRAGQDALATIDGERREAIRRNHTATHLLHAALRNVLGDHVRQQGSLVSPEYLRFDFSHHAAPTAAELDEVFARANRAVLTAVGVETTETSREEAEDMGAIAFFGDKYGSSVRVVQAGDTSLEFCGGTHVDSLGQIGSITLLSEGSIGSNTRRIFAVTGFVSLERALERERLVQAAAEALRSEPDELVPAIGRLAERQRDAEKELARLRQQSSESEATTLAEAAGADGGVVVARRDKVAPDDLRTLAQAVLRHDGVRAVVLGGSPDGAKAAIVAATGGTPDATQLVRTLGRMVGGGGGGSPEVAVAGGKDPSQIEAALAEAQRLLSA
ncbi:MAG TPA: alanine--tRNA ligase [Acidimicrobiales bacterium]|jgi:alanyl-tRNA synthetase|nr:alanine--tRNA ligase [Acidimicrobiales bacterium]